MAVLLHAPMPHAHGGNACHPRHLPWVDLHAHPCTHSGEQDGRGDGEQEEHGVRAEKPVGRGQNRPYRNMVGGGVASVCLQLGQTWCQMYIMACSKEWVNCNGTGIVS